MVMLPLNVSAHAGTKQKIDGIPGHLETQRAGLAIHIDAGLKDRCPGVVATVS